MKIKFYYPYNLIIRTIKKANYKQADKSMKSSSSQSLS